MSSLRVKDNRPVSSSFLAFLLEQNRLLFSGTIHSLGLPSRDQPRAQLLEPR